MTKFKGSAAVTNMLYYLTYSTIFAHPQVFALLLFHVNFACSWSPLTAEATSIVSFFFFFCSNMYRW